MTFCELVSEAVDTWAPALWKCTEEAIQSHKSGYESFTEMVFEFKDSPKIGVKKVEGIEIVFPMKLRRYWTAIVCIDHDKKITLTRSYIDDKWAELTVEEKSSDEQTDTEGNWDPNVAVITWKPGMAAKSPELPF